MPDTHKNKRELRKQRIGPVAQPGRAAAFGAVGRGFKSHRGRQNTFNPRFAVVEIGFIPIGESVS